MRGRDDEGEKLFERLMEPVLVSVRYVIKSKKKKKGVKMGGCLFEKPNTLPQNDL